jgi:hypothetical protein
VIQLPGLRTEATQCTVPSGLQDTLTFVICKQVVQVLGVAVEVLVDGTVGVPVLVAVLVGLLVGVPVRVGVSLGVPLGMKAGV